MIMSEKKLAIVKIDLCILMIRKGKYVQNQQNEKTGMSRGAFPTKKKTPEISLYPQKRVFKIIF